MRYLVLISALLFSTCLTINAQELEHAFYKIKIPKGAVVQKNGKDKSLDYYTSISFPDKTRLEITVSNESTKTRQGSFSKIVKAQRESLSDYTETKSDFLSKFEGTCTQLDEKSKKGIVLLGYLPDRKMHYIFKASYLRGNKKSALKYLKATIESFKPLIKFQESNFGLQFYHPDSLIVAYNPHGSANRITLKLGKIPLGGWGISPAPPGDIKQLISGGKEFYRQKFKASSVKYSLYENPNKYKFHCFKAEIKINGTELITEKYIHLRTPVKKSDVATKVIRKMSGAFSLEVIFPKQNSKQVQADIKKMIDSFKINEI